VEGWERERERLKGGVKSAMEAKETAERARAEALTAREIFKVEVERERERERGEWGRKVKEAEEEWRRERAGLVEGWERERERERRKRVEEKEAWRGEVVERERERERVSIEAHNLTIQQKEAETSKLVEELKREAEAEHAGRERAEARLQAAESLIERCKKEAEEAHNQVVSLLSTRNDGIAARERLEQCEATAAALRGEREEVMRRCVALEASVEVHRVRLEASQADVEAARLVWGVWV
jgi:hypothetical protein